VLPVQYKTTVIIAGSKEATAPVLKSLVESDGVRDRVIADFHLGDRYATGAGLETQIAFGRRVSARPGRDSLLFITVVDHDPAFAAKLADSVAAETIRAAHASRLSTASQDVSRVQSRLDHLARAAKLGAERLGNEGIKDWRTALPDPDRNALAALADLQAEINFTEAKDRESVQSNLLLMQDRLSVLQRQLGERRAGTTALPSPATFEAVKDQYYFAASEKRLRQQLDLLVNDMASEIKTVAPAPVPLIKDSPKRLMFAAGGVLAGLVLAIFLAMALDSGAAGRARSERILALRQAWGLKN
jgi:capsular polysaccharide biosynthesis protein